MAANGWARLEVHYRGGALPEATGHQAMSAPGQLETGRPAAGRYSRSAGLFVARAAGELNGVQRSLDGDGADSTMTLMIRLLP